MPSPLHLSKSQSITPARTCTFKYICIILHMHNYKKFIIVQMHNSTPASIITISPYVRSVNSSQYFVPYSSIAHFAIISKMYWIRFVHGANNRISILPDSSPLLPRLITLNPTFLLQYNTIICNPPLVYLNRNARWLWLVVARSENLMCQTFGIIARNFTLKTLRIKFRFFRNLSWENVSR